MDKNKFDNFDEKEMFKLSKKQMENISDFYLEFTKTRIPWIQRKEISAWSATIFYYAIIWSLGNFIIKLDSNSSKIIPEIFFIIFLILIITICALIFIIFIYVQYQQIFQIIAGSNIAREIMRNIAFEEGKFFSNNKIGNGNDLTKYFGDRKKEYLNNMLFIVNKWRPIVILLVYWIMPFQKASHSKKFRLDNKEIEEASLYYLIITGAIFYIIVVLYNFKLLDPIFEYLAHI